MKWISIFDGLPEKEDFYLVVRRNGRTVSRVKWNGDKFVDNPAYPPIIYWMNLPQMPKERI
jgi:hypothetical protein